MGLSDDQRAMLRLLAQRGEEGYDDVAALMGLSVEEVRAKVAEALAQLDEEGVLASGKPAPGTAADSPAPAAPESSAETGPATEPAEPAKPAPAGPAAAAPPSSKPSPKPPRPRRQPPKISMPSGGGLRAAIAAAAAVIALVVIIIIVSGGGGEDSSATTAAGGGGEATTAAEGAAADSTNPKEVTKAVLKAVDGSEASGVAIFGKVKKSLALEVAIEGLEATGKSTSYTIWLAQSPQRMLPLASTAVDGKGKIAGQYEIPVEVLAYLANETFKDLVVTKTDNKTLEAALKKATEEERAPSYTGTEVLNGTVTGPIVGAAKRIKEAEAEEKGE